MSFSSFCFFLRLWVVQIWSLMVLLKLKNQLFMLQPWWLTYSVMRKWGKGVWNRGKGILLSLSVNSWCKEIYGILTLTQEKIHTSRLIVLLRNVMVHDCKELTSHKFPLLPFRMHSRQVCWQSVWQELVRY